MRRRFLVFTLVILAAILAATTAYTQFNSFRLLVSEVESDETPFVRDDAYPNLSMDLALVNSAGVPVSGLETVDFSLFEDGDPVEDFELAAFINQEQPVSLMLVVDLSESMRDDLPGIRSSLISLYDILDQVDESGIIAFTLQVDGTAVNLAEPFPQLDSNREMTFTNGEGALINLVNGLTIEEGSGAPLYDALVKGVRMMAIQARHERRAVVLITDGSDADRSGALPGSNVANADTAVREALPLGIPIFTVGIGATADSTFLAWAAANSGGAYWNVAGAGQVAPVLAGIVAQLKHTYRLQVTASPPADDAIHTVTIRAHTDSGMAEVTIEYKARYPVVPLVREAAVASPRQGRQPLATLATVKGTVLIEPDIVARGNVTAVNYYLGESQTAIFTARESPWSFAWNTGQLAPGTTQRLVIEVLDDAKPPNVGLFETTVFVQVCNLLCQFEQQLTFNPTYLIAAGLTLVALLAFLLIHHRSRTRPPYTFASEAQPVVPLLQHRPFASPGPDEEVDALRLFSPERADPAAQIRLRAATEVLATDSDPIAFLIDPQSGEALRLGVETTIGRDPDSDLVLDESRVANRHAKVLFVERQYMLAAANVSHSTKVNGQEVLRCELADGDRIEIGGRPLVFRQVR